MNTRKELISQYKNKKDIIKKRLCDFGKFRDADDAAIFMELCFCLMTPGTKAINGGRAVKELCDAGLIFGGTAGKISKKLRGIVRFHNNKASFLVAARKLFCCGKMTGIKCRIDQEDILKTREWLVENVKGLGYKEASHFLRNIGLGRDISILDRHILLGLKKCKVIKEIPESLSRKKYLEIEERMRELSKSVKIPMDELDLLFWSQKTGFVYK